MKKFAVLLICLLLVSGCSTPPSEPVIHQGGNLEAWENFCDLSGAPIDFSGTDVKSFDVRYALGWNFDAPGYRKLYQGDKIGDWEIQELHCKYYINYNNVGEPQSVLCDNNEYTVAGGKKLSGILMADKGGLGFYPYPDQSNHNFLFICERKEDFERTLADKSNLDVGNGKKVQVQPILIGIGGALEDSKLISRVSELLSGTPTYDAAFFATLNEPRYLKAEVQFSEITVYPYTVGEGAGIEGTRAIAYIADDNDIVVDSL